MLKTYCIKEGYTIRPDNDFDNEIGKRDECQDDVYRYARKVLDDRGLGSVLDIGTGSGFKLMKYFSDKLTLGLDLPPTIDWVRTQYPDRSWGSIPLDEPGQSPIRFDLVIAADIIEHLLDPDQLLNFIAASRPKFAVISTPNRDNLQDMFADGPPRNLCHVREWTAAEFKEYIGQHFEVIEHLTPPEGQKNFSTMWVLARP